MFFLHNDDIKIHIFIFFAPLEMYFSAYAIQLFFIQLGIPHFKYWIVELGRIY